MAMFKWHMAMAAKADEQTIENLGHWVEGFYGGENVVLKNNRVDGGSRKIPS